jgi:hypothetical protein
MLLAYGRVAAEMAHKKIVVNIRLRQKDSISWGSLELLARKPSTREIIKKAQLSSAS